MALGIRTAVVSPGSRSTPMALALLAHPQLDVQVFLDERSAAFAALGVGLAQGVPAILLCTSGTAAVEFHPAVVEAHEARVPMLVCTADRPPELQGVGAPQTIDQRNLYGVAVRRFEDPGVPDDEQAQTWRALARRTFEATRGAHAGPVHLNLAFREPLVGAPEALPDRAPYVPDTEDLVARSDDTSWVSDRCSGARGVLVAGRGCGDPEVIAQLAERLDWPLIADPRSGCRHPGIGGAMLVAHADALLRTDVGDRNHPDVVVRFGEPPASKVVNAWLASVDTSIVVSASTAIHDPDRVVIRQILTDPTQFARAIVADPAPPGWGDEWRRLSARTMEALARIDQLSEPAVAQIVGECAPVGSSLVVSSSMPIRDLEWFASVVVPDVYANRGVNGIDGVVSTALGVALGAGGTVVVLVGDIAFLHDSNAMLGLAARGADLRIVVVDNNGGGIFSFLPQARTTDTQTFERLWGTPHGVDMASLAAAHGVQFVSCDSNQSLRDAIARRGPTVIHVRTDRHQNVAIHDALNQRVVEALRS